MHEFKHPKYYTELRKRNKSDQAISKEPATAGNQRSPDPGLKQEDSSDKQQAFYMLPIIYCKGRRFAVIY